MPWDYDLRICRIQLKALPDRILHHKGKFALTGRSVISIHTISEEVFLSPLWVPDILQIIAARVKCCLIFYLMNIVHGLEVSVESVAVYLPVAGGSRHGYLAKLLPGLYVGNMYLHLDNILKAL